MGGDEPRPYDLGDGWEMKGSDWRLLVDGIAQDTTSGASELTRRAAAALRLAAAERRGSLVARARACVLAQPAMGGICRMASLALDSRDPAREVGEFLGTLEAGGAEVASRAVPLITEAGSVLTLSASSVVQRSLCLAHDRGWDGRAICLESRPMLEGRTLARVLAEAGVQAVLAIDAAGPRLAQEVDLVLLGADTIAPAGLVHKIGTLGVALAAQRSGTASYVLAGSEKLLPGLVRGALDSRGDATDVQGGLAGVGGWTSFFDLSPLELFTGFVTEEGVQTGLAISAAAAAVQPNAELRDLLV